MPALTAGAPFARSAMAYVLAGGQGSRLLELTEWRAKPAVHFGGKSRIIDFALSNALNSGIRRIGVATQYKAHSLIRHLQRGWNFFRLERNESFDILPASQRVADGAWYAGTADAVFQNIDIIESYAPKYIVILAGDHIYKMDYEPMLVQHVEQNADVTVGCLEVPRERGLGASASCMSTTTTTSARSSRSRQNPPTMPGKPDMALASMGVYVFDTAFLFEQLRRDAADPAFQPRLRQGHHPLYRQATAARSRTISRAPACAPAARRRRYWRDVGTLDAYWAANMDLTDIVPQLDLYDRNWPIWTFAEISPPAKFVHDQDGRRGQAVSSLVSGGCIISGATRAAVAAVHQRPPALLLARWRTRSSCRRSRSAARSGSRTSSSTAACAFPMVWSSAKTRSSMHARFRRTEGGICLITQAMIDKLGE